MPHTHDSLELRIDYWSDAAATAAFRAFMVDIHRLDFTAWVEAGCWDADYRPFTYFREGRVVSSVCLYSMDMVVDGRATRVAQVSGVGTVPEARRQGLNRELTALAMDWARDTGHAFFYLFAEDDAVPYYRRMGFVPADEHAPVVHVEGGAPRPGGRPLRIEDARDFALVRRLAATRSPVSRRLGVRNERLLLFHVLYGLGAGAVYVEPLDVVVFATRRGTTLTLFDVVGARMPSLAELYPFLTAPGDRAVELRFAPDALDVAPDELRLLAGQNLHLSADAPLTAPFVVPYTAHA